MRTIILVSIYSVGLIVGPASVSVAAAAPSEQAAEKGKSSVAARILGALDLPLKAQALRKAGADEKEVKAGLKAVRDSKVAAGEAAELLGAAAESARDHGPVGNFGAFVKERLGEGLRGKQLAEAIRNEHAAKGKGKPDKGGPHGDAAKEPGKAAEAGNGDGAGGAGGKPDDRGGPADPGKPDDPGAAGKAGEAGKPGKPGEAGDADDAGAAGKAGEAGKPGDAGKPGKPGDAGKPGKGDEKADKGAGPK